jgi:hypothetical protein
MLVSELIQRLEQLNPNELVAAYYLTIGDLAYDEPLTADQRERLAEFWRESGARFAQYWLDEEGANLLSELDFKFSERIYK